MLTTGSLNNSMSSWNELRSTMNTMLTTGSQSSIQVQLRANRLIPTIDRVCWNVAHKNDARMCDKQGIGESQTLQTHTYTSRCTHSHTDTRIYTWSGLQLTNE